MGALLSKSSDTAGSSGGEGETLVALRGDLVAPLAVRADPTGVRHEDAGLAGHVRAHVPGVRLGVEGLAGDLVDVRDPVVLSLLGGLDGAQALRREVLDDPGDP